MEPRRRRKQRCLSIHKTGKKWQLLAGRLALFLLHAVCRCGLLCGIASYGPTDRRDPQNSAAYPPTKNEEPGRSDC
jgi:hypothetical protein